MNILLCPICRTCLDGWPPVSCAEHRLPFKEERGVWIFSNEPNVTDKHLGHDALASDYDLYLDYENFSANIFEGTARAVAREVGNRRLILDLGAGTGNYSLPLAALDNRVIAADISTEMLAVLARKLNPETSGRLLPCKMNAYSLPIESGVVDAVIVVLVLQHVSDPAAVVAEIRRVLKPGGVLIAQYFQGCQPQVTKPPPVHRAIQEAFREKLPSTRKIVNGWAGRQADKELPKHFGSVRILEPEELEVTCTNSAGWLLRKFAHRVHGYHQINESDWSDFMRATRESLQSRFGADWQNALETIRNRYRLAMYQA